MTTHQRQDSLFIPRLECHFQRMYLHPTSCGKFQFLHKTFRFPTVLGRIPTQRSKRWDCGKKLTENRLGDIHRERQIRRSRPHRPDILYTLIGVQRISINFIPNYGSRISLPIGPHLATANQCIPCSVARDQFSSSPGFTWTALYRALGDIRKFRSAPYD